MDELSRADYEAARTGAALFEVPARGKVVVTGPDAPSFLHNLCSNDVKNLAPGSGCEAFFLTAKAKVVVYAVLWRLPVAPGGSPSFWLDVSPYRPAATLIKHLDHYLISEQVELTDHTVEFNQVHLAGPQARALLEKILGNLPELDPMRLAVVPLEGIESCWVGRHDVLGVPGYDLVYLDGQPVDVEQRLLEAGATPAVGEAYEVLRVEAGTPEDGRDIDENTFAPEVGRTRQAISYTKGCYLGQEPVVMARDRGQVNRTLMGLKLSGGPAPDGSLLYRDGKEAGRVTSCVVSPRLGPIALAYVRRGNQDPGTVVEVEVEGQRRAAEVVPLPFV